MQHIILMHIIPFTWMLASLIALGFSYPVLRRFWLNKEQAKRNLFSKEKVPLNRFIELQVTYNAAIVDFRTKALVAFVAFCFLLIGIIVELSLPFIWGRIITTVILYLSNFAIAFKFWMEEQTFKREERRILGR